MEVAASRPGLDLATYTRIRGPTALPLYPVGSIQRNEKTERRFSIRSVKIPQRHRKEQRKTLACVRTKILKLLTRRYKEEISENAKRSRIANKVEKEKEEKRRMRKERVKEERRRLRKLRDEKGEREDKRRKEKDKEEKR